MFLNELNKTQKDAFVNLSICAAEANDDFAVEEKTMIDEYCREMGIVFENVAKLSMEQITEIFQQADYHIKKISLFELIGLLFADSVLDQKEKDFLYKYAHDIGLEENDVNIQVEVMKEYLAVLKKIMDIL